MCFSRHKAIFLGESWRTLILQSVIAVDALLSNAVQPKLMLFSLLFANTLQDN